MDLFAPDQIRRVLVVAPAAYVAVVLLLRDDRHRVRPCEHPHVVVPESSLGDGSAITPVPGWDRPGS